MEKTSNKTLVVPGAYSANVKEPVVGAPEVKPMSGSIITDSKGKVVRSNAGTAVRTGA